VAVLKTAGGWRQEEGSWELAKTEYRILHAARRTPDASKLQH